MRRDRRGVLVTGSHRSGSTWLGRMLGSADELHYVQEPFNIVARQRWLTPRPDRQFVYLDDELGSAYVDGIERILDLRYPLAAHVRQLAGRRDLAMMRRATGIALEARRARRQGAVPLVKDPIAIFSTEWLLDRFGIEPVVLVREPVAFVGSLKAREWTFDFRHWAEQPALMQRIAPRWREQIEAMVARPDDVVAQGILQWNVFYDFVADLVTRRPEVHLLSYEEVAAAPEAVMPDLFERLGLTYGADQERTIVELSRTESGQGQSAIDVRRSSQQALKTGQRRLETEEREAVVTATDDVTARLEAVWRAG